MARVQETRMHKLFWQQTSYSAGTCKIKRWKITLRCTEVTQVLQAFELGILHVTVTTFMTWRPGTSKEKSDSTDLSYNLNMSTDVSVRNVIKWVSIYFSK